jgi:hypothetical protein
MITSTVLACVPYVWPIIFLAPLSLAGKHVLSPQVSKDMTSVSFFPFPLLNIKEGKRHDMLMLMATSGMEDMSPKLTDIPQRANE